MSYTENVYLFIYLGSLFRDDKNFSQYILYRHLLVIFFSSDKTKAFWAKYYKSISAFGMSLLPDKHFLNFHHRDFRSLGPVAPSFEGIIRAWGFPS